MTPADELVRPSDLRQYAYCPRVVFYHVWMPRAGVATEAMKAGLVGEEQLRALEKRRKLKRYGLSEGKRSFRVELFAPALGLSGIVDLLIETPAGLFPVEFKSAGRAAPGHELQLAAYAMMVGEVRGSCDRGFLYLFGAGQVITVPLTSGLEAAVISTAEAVRDILRFGLQPEPTLRRVRCRGCEYLHFCGDVYETQDRGDEEATDARGPALQGAQGGPDPVHDT